MGSNTELYPKSTKNFTFVELNNLIFNMIWKNKLVEIIKDTVKNSNQVILDHGEKSTESKSRNGLVQMRILVCGKVPYNLQCVEIDFKILEQLDSCLEKTQWGLARWVSRQKCIMPSLTDNLLHPQDPMPKSCLLWNIN